MQITDYILNELKPLDLQATIAMAKRAFNNSVFTHIPVIENGNLYGLVSENDLQTLEDDTAILNDCQDLFHQFFGLDSQHWLDILKIFSLNETTLLPILDAQKKYLGYVELTDVLHFFNSTPFLNDQGDILVISKEKSNFLLSEVIQIIESNNAKLLGIFVSKTTNDNVEVTLKMYSENRNDVIHSFRRYNYDIIVGINEDEYLNDLKERSEYLQKYLSI